MFFCAKVLLVNGEHVSYFYRTSGNLGEREMLREHEQLNRREFPQSFRFAHACTSVSQYNSIETRRTFATNKRKATYLL